MEDRHVVFVDDVDSAAGPRVTGTMRIESRMPGSAGSDGVPVARQSGDQDIPSLRRHLAGRPWNGISRAYVPSESGRFVDAAGTRPVASRDSHAYADAAQVRCMQSETS